MNRFIKYYVIIVSLIATRAYSQDPHFSQFYETPLQINPAMTAVNGDMRVLANYRDQWRSVSKPFTTYAISVEAKMKNSKWRPKDNASFLTKAQRNIGAGLSIYRDKAGDLNMGVTKADFSLSSQVYISQFSSISLGLQGGFAQRSYNLQNANFESQHVTGNVPNISNKYEQNSFSGDYSVGLLYKYGKNDMFIASNDQVKVNFGVALQHLNAPKYSFDKNQPGKLYRKVVAHGGFIIGIKNTNVQIAPMVLFMKQGPSSELTIGSLIKYRLKEASKYTGFNKETLFSVGGYLRAKDAIIAQVMFEKGQYAIGFSYDINISRLTPVSKSVGGFEISLRFLTPNPFLYGSKSRI